MKDSDMKVDQVMTSSLYINDSAFNRTVDFYYNEEQGSTLGQFMKDNLDFLLYQTVLLKQDQINNIKHQLIMPPKPIKMQVGREGEEND